jgi:hypothetical protein
LLVWADNDPEQGDLHADFKLSSGGEEIALCDGQATGFAVIDAYLFGPQAEDVSEGRDPDAGDDWIFYPYPTPGVSNALSDIPPRKTPVAEVMAYPNPLPAGSTLFFNKKVSGTLFTVAGQKVLDVKSTSRLTVPVFGAALMYFRTVDGKTVKIIIQ